MTDPLSKDQQLIESMATLHAPAAAAMAMAVRLGWRPIETADTSQLFASSMWVLIATDEPRVTEATPFYFDGGGYMWMTARGSNVRGSCPVHDPMLRYKATHWMPLPEPPT